MTRGENLEGWVDGCHLVRCGVEIMCEAGVNASRGAEAWTRMGHELHVTLFT